MNEIAKYHSLAKDAGNKLRAYILSVASGGAGVFFLALTKSDITKYTSVEKCLLVIAVIGFVLTVILSLYELRLDAQRFFALAKELEKEESKQNWEKNEKFKNKRLLIINSSYILLGISVLCVSIYLVLKILST